MTISLGTSPSFELISKIATPLSTWRPWTAVWRSWTLDEFHFQYARLPLKIVKSTVPITDSRTRRDGKG